MLEWQEALQNFIIKSLEVSADPIDIGGLRTDPFGRLIYLVVVDEKGDGPGSAYVTANSLKHTSGESLVYEGQMKEGTAALELIYDYLG